MRRSFYIFLVSLGGFLGSFQIAQASPIVDCGCSDETYIPGVPFRVMIEAAPPAQARSYSIELSIPSGWEVFEFNEGGVFDGTARKARWGPFSDAANRFFTFLARTPRSAYGSPQLSGVVTVDGVSTNFQTRPFREIHRIARIDRIESGFKLLVEGSTARPYTVEASADLVKWRASGAVTNVNNSLEWVDGGASQPGKFYRVTGLDPP